MVILGLTGSIAMGKSTAANLLRAMGLPLHDADQAVHALMRPGGAGVGAIAELFPDALVGGGIDRSVLAKKVLDAGADPGAGLAALEAILHPLVKVVTRKFLARHARAASPLVILDIPLLFETGAQQRCDGVVVVSAPRRVQLQRLAQRCGMTPQRLARLEARQLPDMEKRQRADFVVPSGLGRAVTRRALWSIVTDLRGVTGQAWSPHWGQ